ncbi:DNA polymerase III PolC-type [bioreactor metagenome]|uniref:DNA polymerase III PolC-type n=1 Tax=bioreactor metagenome TaxID=1076179 RepID=A0A644ZXR7_9ZZZZ
MIVVSLSNCPPHLRGSLTKWLEEIDTCVYVGHVPARVRDAIWKQITSELENGRAAMVFSARNEQHMDFRVYNSEWEPIDFDGIKLILRPSASYRTQATDSQSWRSTTSGIRMAKCANAHHTEDFPHSYIIVDVETTGLSIETDRMIEIGALRVVDDEVADEYSVLIAVNIPIPENIENLTGITNALVQQSGIDEKKAVSGFLDFAGGAIILSYNIRFDYGFLRTACRHHELPPLYNKSFDVAELARRIIYDLENYKLSTLASYFSVSTEGAHRAIADCQTTKRIYDKLIEKKK